MRRRSLALAGACAVALVASACGSDDEPSGGSGSADGASGSTLSIGVLTSLSGPAATTFTSAPDAVRARFAAYEEDGGECADEFDFEVVEGDDTSSPQGALAAAQRLVQQDDVFGIVNVSSLFFGAAQFLVTQGQEVPVFGTAFDGAPEWRNADDNLFVAGQLPNYDVAYSGSGQFLADQGGTVVAGISFDQPASQQGLELYLQSAEAAGLKRGYVNDSVPFGSTDIGPIVLGIIESGADVIAATVTADTGLAIVAGLRQAGYDTAAVVLPNGYGADLLASPPAVELAQGINFTVEFTPIELQTEATQRFSQALLDHTGNASGIPGFAEASAWLGADLLLHSLEETGCDATQADVISMMQGDTDWDAGGLYENPVPQNTFDYDETCSYYVKLEGDAFVPVEDASPLCGTPLD